MFSLGLCSLLLPALSRLTNLQLMFWLSSHQEYAKQINLLYFWFRIFLLVQFWIIVLYGWLLLRFNLDYQTVSRHNLFVCFPSFIYAIYFPLLWTMLCTGLKWIDLTEFIPCLTLSRIISNSIPLLKNAC